MEQLFHLIQRNLFTRLGEILGFSGTQLVRLILDFGNLLFGLFRQLFHVKVFGLFGNAAQKS